MTLEQFCQTLRSILDAIDNDLDDFGLANDQRKYLRGRRPIILGMLKRLCPEYVKDWKKVKPVGKVRNK